MWRQIRWRQAARGAAVLGACLVLLKLAPALLRPPDPPPIEPDVGLPRVPPAPSRHEGSSAAHNPPRARIGLTRHTDRRDEKKHRRDETQHRRDEKEDRARHEAAADRDPPRPKVAAPEAPTPTPVAPAPGPSATSPEFGL